MQVAVQPLWRQPQPDTLVLLWQPPVPKEHLTLLYHLPFTTLARVIMLYTLSLQSTEAGLSAGG